MKEYIAVFRYNGEIMNLEFSSKSISQESLIAAAKQWICDYLGPGAIYQFIQVIPKYSNNE